MSFAWKTNFIGYPNFFSGNKPSHKLGMFFRLIARAAKRGDSYAGIKSQAKAKFKISPHQTETKKAAFQEFGLAYVIPRSNTISITPAGSQLFDIAETAANADTKKRKVLLLLARALARYQFKNPFPAGARQIWADSTDVLPYLATFYLFLKLDGLITQSELFGAIFGLQKMKDLPFLVSKISDHRRNGRVLRKLAGLPADSKTLENLKIYFMAHAGLDGQILSSELVNLYGFEEQCYELSETGLELLETVLNTEWPAWKKSSRIPVAKKFIDIKEYFDEGIGAPLPELVFNKDSKLAERTAIKNAAGVLTPEDVENLCELPRRSFKEGQRKMVTHARAERNQTLVREAKRRFKRQHGRLFCEACKFEFMNRYGERGRDFIEAHHSKPISTLFGSIPTTVDDLEMVCSNCHRMLHRRPWITVQKLRDSL